MLSFCPGNWFEGQIPIAGKCIYDMLLWMCAAPFLSFGNFLAFVLYQTGAGAPYNAWLHDIFTYVFAGGFSDIKRPEAMNFVELFSNLCSLPDVMEELTKLTGT